MLDTPAPAGDDFVALIQSQMAFFTWCLDQGLMFGDETLASLFDIDGRDLARGMTIMPIMERIDEADRARVARSLHQAITTGDLYQESYRIRHRNGTIRTVTAAGRCLRDIDNVPSIFSGTIIDITAIRHLAESDPLEIHCMAALELARARGMDLAARYINSAIGVLHNSAVA